MRSDKFPAAIEVGPRSELVGEGRSEGLVDSLDAAGSNPRVSRSAVAAGAGIVGGANAVSVRPAAVVRRGKREDVPALLDIYNHEVENGVATLDLEPRTLEQWTAWFDSHQNDLHPLFVAELDGRPVGYTTLSPYRPKDAYRSTTELSVYVSPEARGRGLANTLLDALIGHARASEEIHLIVSVITGNNAASMALHERYGFEKCGAVHEAGFKMGCYHDIVFYELIV